VLRRCDVPIAVEVARALGAPLNVRVVPQRGRSGEEELAMGAIARSDVRGLDEDVDKSLEVPPSINFPPRSAEVRERAGPVEAIACPILHLRAGYTLILV
jgi:hypothetical protein